MKTVRKFLKPAECLFRNSAGRAFSALSFALLFLLLHPLDVLQAERRDGSVLFSAPALLGEELRLRMVHSVQRTPVEDFYRFQEGRIWPWRERVQSHNAGLPFAAPPRGRFYLDPPWMVTEGGNAGYEEISYRVGNADVGRNEAAFSSSDYLPLYLTVPGELLRLRLHKGRTADFLF